MGFSDPFNEHSMKQRDELLDLVRGGSAVLVLVAHVRAFFFKDFAELSDPGVIDKAFYFFTSLHHQAVMVFFVLSGYFVGGTVCAQISRGQFSLKRYAVARLSRLWTVLVPALILTAVCDGIGRAVAPAAYEGLLRTLFMSGPTPEVPADLSAWTFVGNLFFLQTVEMPVYGSNGPLWSLANEFWYYVLFPLCALVIVNFRGKPLKAMGWAIMFCGLVSWLPSALVFHGGIWLLGVAVWWLRPLGLLSTRIPVCAVATFALLSTLALSKTDSLFGRDFAVGLGFAGWLWCFKGLRLRGAVFRRIAVWLSDISFTLYVTHFPLLFLLAAVGYGGVQWLPGPLAYAGFIAISAALLVGAWLLWLAFESRTETVRKWIM
jgi:peptidoglycan/LPS O-acetylase OafA/YrhL